MVYAAAQCCTCRAKISSAGSSPLTKKLRMGCAHDGASTTVSTATGTRAVGLGGSGLEMDAACCIVEVLGPTVAAPGPSSEVPGLGATVAVPEPPGEVPGPAAAAPRPGSEVPGPGATVAVREPPVEVSGPAAATPELDPTVLVAAGMKMDSDSGEGLIDGLRRH
nr:translation initiation factor IF-2-like [Aegilops tauschii subsp. strangulata]